MKKKTICTQHRWLASLVLIRPIKTWLSVDILFMPHKYHFTNYRLGWKMNAWFCLVVNAFVNWACVYLCLAKLFHLPPLWFRLMVTKKSESLSWHEHYFSCWQAQQRRKKARRLFKSENNNASESKTWRTRCFSHLFYVYVCGRPDWEICERRCWNFWQSKFCGVGRSSIKSYI